MPHAALHDKVLRSLEIPSQGQIDYWDTTFKGFGVRVSQGGSKTFILNIDKTRRTIGRYPIISLAEARTEARKLLAERTLGKTRPQSITFPKAVEQFLEEKRKSRRTRTADDYEYYLDRFFPFKGQLSDATHAEVSRRLDRIKKPSLYNHTLASARGFFNWCVKRRYLDDNPVRGLSPHKSKRRSRVLTDNELAAIWRASDSETLPEAFRSVVKLLIAAGLRRSEAAALRSTYYSHNQQTICFPSELTKNHQEFCFPLGSFATSILKSPLASALENDRTLLFPARGKRDKPFNGWSKSKRELDRLSGVEGWVLHDLRRTFKTTLSKLKVAPHISERMLNHITGQTELERTYDQHRYLEEMREAQERYEAHLCKILELG